jgi:hypothetical protein
MVLDSSFWFGRLTGALWITRLVPRGGDVAVLDGDLDEVSEAEGAVRVHGPRHAVGVCRRDWCSTISWFGLIWTS